MNPVDLTRHLDAYLSLREALGFQMVAERLLLPDFVEFVITHNEDEPIRAQFALDWAWTGSSRRGTSGAASRLRMARRFLIYLHAINPQIEIPEQGLIADDRRTMPYLFTPSQIDALITAARCARPQNSLRPYALATLLGLLASTGLRVGEALRLSMADIKLDATPPRLHIRQTKFQKSRWVPLHPTAAKALRIYSEQRQQLRYDALSDTFLLSAQGRAINHDSLCRWFSHCCQQLHIWPLDDDSRRPCLTSFRHTFAVERLRYWYQQGQDVRALLPQLSVYLGHVRPEETFWYLTATPELLATAAVRFQQYAPLGETL